MGTPNWFRGKSLGSGRQLKGAGRALPNANEATPVNERSLLHSEIDPRDELGADGDSAEFALAAEELYEFVGA